MPTLRRETDRQQLVARLKRLTPHAQPRWGSLDASRMLCHLADAQDAGLGDLEVKPTGPRAFRHFPLKHLAIYVVPMPRNTKAPPEMLTTHPGDFEDDRRRVLEGMSRMATAPLGQGPDHFLLGRLTWDQWNILNWKHIDHHLRQFGS